LRKKNVSIKGEPLTETQATNEMKGKLKKQMTLKQQLKIFFACNDFGKEEELWYRCTGCRIWVHEDYSEWDS